MSALEIFSVVMIACGVIGPLVRMLPWKGVHYLGDIFSAIGAVDVAKVRDVHERLKRGDD